MQLIEALLPEKTIKGIIAYRGTERTMGPPKSLNPCEAPFRRAIIKSRATQKVFVEAEWEKYDQCPTDS